MMGQGPLAGNPLPACAALLSSAQTTAALAFAEPDSPDAAEFTAENSGINSAEKRTYSGKFRPNSGKFLLYRPKIG
jgi:hypothetical protein